MLRPRRSHWKACTIQLILIYTGYSNSAAIPKLVALRPQDTMRQRKATSTVPSGTQGRGRLEFATAYV